MQQRASTFEPGEQLTHCGCDGPVGQHHAPAGHGEASHGEVAAGGVHDKLALQARQDGCRAEHLLGQPPGAAAGAGVGAGRPSGQLCTPSAACKQALELLRRCAWAHKGLAMRGPGLCSACSVRTACLGTCLPSEATYCWARRPSTTACTPASASSVPALIVRRPHRLWRGGAADGARSADLVFLALLEVKRTG